MGSSLVLDDPLLLSPEWVVTCLPCVSIAFHKQLRKEYIGATTVNRSSYYGDGRKMCRLSDDMMYRTHIM